MARSSLAKAVWTAPNQRLLGETAHARRMSHLTQHHRMSKIGKSSRALKRVKFADFDKGKQSYISSKTKQNKMKKPCYSFFTRMKKKKKLMASPLP